MLRNRLFTLALVMTIVVLASNSGHALDSLIVNINQAAAIVNPEDATDVRALLRFDLPTIHDTTKIVTFAELRFVVNTPVAFERPIRLKICPITRSWSPTGNIGWSGPWTHPVGDFADTISCMAHIDTCGQTTIKADVARLIRYYINNNLENNGLIIYQHGNLRIAFSMVNNRLPGTAVAQLAIYYVDMNRE
jgi:hypothetical protein